MSLPHSRGPGVGEGGGRAPLSLGIFLETLKTQRRVRLGTGREGRAPTPSPSYASCPAGPARSTKRGDNLAGNKKPQIQDLIQVGWGKEEKVSFGE